MCDLRLGNKDFCVDRQHVGLQILYIHTRYLYIHTRMHGRADECTHTNAHTHALAHTCTHTHTHTHMHTQKKTHTHTHFHQRAYLPCPSLYFSPAYKTLFSAFSTIHHQMFGRHGYPREEPCHCGLKSISLLQVIPPMADSHVNIQ